MAEFLKEYSIKLIADTAQAIQGSKDLEKDVLNAIQNIKDGFTELKGPMKQVSDLISSELESAAKQLESQFAKTAKEIEKSFKSVRTGNVEKDLDASVNAMKELESAAKDTSTKLNRIREQKPTSSQDASKEVKNELKEIEKIYKEAKGKFALEDVVSYDPEEDIKEIGDLFTTIKVKDKQLQEEIKRGRRELGDNSAEAVEKGEKRILDAIKKATEKQIGLYKDASEREINIIEKQAKEAIAAEQKRIKEIEEDTRLSEAEKKEIIKKANENILKITRETGKKREQIEEKTVKAINEANKQLEERAKRVKSVAAARKEQAPNEKQIARIGSYGKIMGEVTDKTAGFGGAIKGTLGKLGPYGKALAVAVGALAAFAAGASKAFAAANEFDRTLTNTQAKLGQSNKEYEVFKANLLAIERPLGTTANQVGEIANEVRKWANPDEIIQTTEALANLNAATGTENVEKMSSILQQATGIMGDSAAAADLLAVASQKSSVPIEKLGENALKLSSKLNVFIDDSKQAATEGVAVYTRLLDVFDKAEAKSIAEQMGMSFEKAFTDPKILDSIQNKLPKGLSLLDVGLDKNNASMIKFVKFLEEGGEAAEQVANEFGTKVAVGFKALQKNAEQSGNSVANLYSELSNSAGGAKQIVDDSTNTFDRKLAEIKQSWENITLFFGESFRGTAEELLSIGNTVLGPLVDYLTPVEAKAQATFKRFQALETAAGGLAATTNTLNNELATLGNEGENAGTKIDAAFSLADKQLKSLDLEALGPAAKHLAGEVESILNNPESKTAEGLERLVSSMSELSELSGALSFAESVKAGEQSLSAIGETLSKLAATGRTWGEYLNETTGNSVDAFIQLEERLESTKERMAELESQKAGASGEELIAIQTELAELSATENEVLAARIERDAVIQESIQKQMELISSRAAMSGEEINIEQEKENILLRLNEQLGLNSALTKQIYGDKVAEMDIQGQLTEMINQESAAILEKAELKQEEQEQLQFEADKKQELLEIVAMQTSAEAEQNTLYQEKLANLGSWTELQGTAVEQELEENNLLSEYLSLQLEKINNELHSLNLNTEQGQAEYEKLSAIQESIQARIEAAQATEYEKNVQLELNQLSVNENDIKQYTNKIIDSKLKGKQKDVKAQIKILEGLKEENTAQIEVLNNRLKGIQKRFQAEKQAQTGIIKLEGVHQKAVNEVSKKQAELNRLKGEGASAVKSSVQDYAKQAAAIDAQIKMLEQGNSVIDDRINKLKASASIESAFSHLGPTGAPSAGGGGGKAKKPKAAKQKEKIASDHNKAMKKINTDREKEAKQAAKEAEKAAEAERKAREKLAENLAKIQEKYNESIKKNREKYEEQVKKLAEKREDAARKEATARAKEAKLLEYGTREREEQEKEYLRKLNDFRMGLMNKISGVISSSLASIEQIIVKYFNSAEKLEYTISSMNDKNAEIIEQTQEELDINEAALEQKKQALEQESKYLAKLKSENEGYTEQIDKLTQQIVNLENAMSTLDLRVNNASDAFVRAQSSYDAIKETAEDASSRLNQDIRAIRDTIQPLTSKKQGLAMLAGQARNISAAPSSPTLVEDLKSVASAFSGSAASYRESGGTHSLEFGGRTITSSFAAGLGTKLQEVLESAARQVQGQIQAKEQEIDRLEREKSAGGSDLRAASAELDTAEQQKNAAMAERDRVKEQLRELENKKESIMQGEAAASLQIYDKQLTKVEKLKLQVGELGNKTAELGRQLRENMVADFGNLSLATTIMDDINEKLKQQSSILETTLESDSIEAFEENYAKVQEILEKGEAERFLSGLKTYLEPANIQQIKDKIKENIASLEEEIAAEKDKTIKVQLEQQKKGMQKRLQEFENFFVPGLQKIMDTTQAELDNYTSVFLDKSLHSLVAGLNRMQKEADSAKSQLEALLMTPEKQAAEFDKIAANAKAKIKELEKELSAATNPKQVQELTAAIAILNKQLEETEDYELAFNLDRIREIIDASRQVEERPAIDLGGNLEDLESQFEKDKALIEEFITDSEEQARALKYLQEQYSKDVQNIIMNFFNKSTEIVNNTVGGITSAFDSVSNLVQAFDSGEKGAAIEATGDTMKLVGNALLKAPYPFSAIGAVILASGMITKLVVNMIKLFAKPEESALDVANARAEEQQAILDLYNAQREMLNTLAESESYLYDQARERLVMEQKIFEAYIARNSEAQKYLDLSAEELAVRKSILNENKANYQTLLSQGQQILETGSRSEAGDFVREYGEQFGIDDSGSNINRLEEVITELQAAITNTETDQELINQIEAFRKSAEDLMKQRQEEIMSSIDFMINLRTELDFDKFDLKRNYRMKMNELLQYARNEFQQAFDENAIGFNLEEFIIPNKPAESIDAIRDYIATLTDLSLEGIGPELQERLQAMFDSLSEYESWLEQEFLYKIDNDLAILEQRLRANDILYKDFHEESLALLEEKITKLKEWGKSEVEILEAVGNAYDFYARAFSEAKENLELQFQSELLTKDEYNANMIKLMEDRLTQLTDQNDLLGDTGRLDKEIMQLEIELANFREEVHNQELEALQEAMELERRRYQYLKNKLNFELETNAIRQLEYNNQLEDLLKNQLEYEEGILDSLYDQDASQKEIYDQLELIIGIELELYNLRKGQNDLLDDELVNMIRIYQERVRLFRMEQQGGTFDANQQQQLANQRENIKQYLQGQGYSEGAIEEMLKGLPQFQKGGYNPYPIALAHKGEYIIPQDKVDEIGVRTLKNIFETPSYKPVDNLPDRIITKRAIEREGNSYNTNNDININLNQTINAGQNSNAVEIATAAKMGAKQGLSNAVNELLQSRKINIGLNQ